MNVNESLITKNQYETLVRDISVLFLYQPTINLIAKDETINKIICDDLDIIFTYENLNTTIDAKIPDFLVAYKTLSGVEYKPHNLNVKEIDDADDKINVLKIFIKNSINTDWTEVLSSFRDTVKPDGTVDTSLAASVEEHKAPETVDTVSVNASEAANHQNNNQSQKPFNSEDFIKKNHVNMDQIADTMINSYATRLYQNDIISNKFYRFDSKPSIFVWIKWIYIIFGIAFALLYLITQIVLLSTSGQIFYFGDYVDGDKVETDIFKKNSNFYYHTYLFSLLLAVLFSGFVFINFYGQVKNNKNDNVKYSCKVLITALMIIFFITTILLPVFERAISPFNWIDKLQIYRDVPPGNLYVGPTMERISINNGKTYGLLLALSVLYISCCVTLGINSIFAVIIKVIRPKEDIQRIRALIQKYVDDIKSGRITMDGTSSGSSGFFGGRNPFSPF